MLVHFNKVVHFNSDIDFFFSNKNNSIFIKGLHGVLSLYMPSKFFYKLGDNSIKFIFNNYFFFKSFISHIVVFSDYLSIVYFAKFKIRGLGYKMRRITSSLFYFFFNYTNYFYFFLPYNILLSVYKKRSIILSYN